MPGGLVWHLLRVLGPRPCPTPGDGASQALPMLNHIHRLPAARIYFISIFALANAYPPVPGSRGVSPGAGDMVAAGPGLRFHVQEGFRLCHASCL